MSIYTTNSIENAKTFTPRIAVASSDGKLIDQHFVTTKFFWIYELRADYWELVEARENEHGACGCSTGGCGPETFATQLSLLHDCDLVVANRIGGEATLSLLDAGIRGHLSSSTVTETLQQLKTSPKLKHRLIRRGAYHHG